MNVATTTRANADEYLSSRNLENIMKFLSAEVERKILNGQITRTPVTERDRNLLQNIATSLSAKGCMVDYAVNVGLASAWNQWITFLENDGRLQVPISMRNSFGYKISKAES